MTAFTDTMAAIPTAMATQTIATGFIPPFFRANGHLLFALGLTVKDNLPEDEGDVLAELQEAIRHLRALEGVDRLSETSKALVENFVTLTELAAEEYPTWPANQRVLHLRNLINRGGAISVRLDRELLGLTTSDAGQEL